MTLLSSSFLLLALAVASRADSPDAYQPSTKVGCPDTNTLLRTFTPGSPALNPQEVDYVSQRQTNVIPNEWRNWLGDGSGIGYNLTAFEGRFPNVSISISGGGYRAAQYGAGVVSALDSRNSSSKAAGTGGLLQVASYFSGLSGGSWLTGSLYLNNWPTVPDMIFGNGNDLSGWLLDLSLPTPGGRNILNRDNRDFYDTVLDSAQLKLDVGLNTSITDIWARLLSYHFLNGTTRDNFFSDETAHGAGQRWSQITSLSAFQNHIPPFPIVVANSLPNNISADNDDPPSLQDVVYEITPLEFGSWDPNLSAMANLSFAGTHLTNGNPDNSTACVTGYDQAGFIMGTSASLFNIILDMGDEKVDGFDSDDSSGFFNIIRRLFRRVSSRGNAVANWPNPFQGLSSSTYKDTDSEFLSLVDGGENLENVPIGPMFLRARNMDFIVAVDGSNDTTAVWPNGTSLLMTSQRLASVLSSTHHSFPPIPGSADDFVSTGTSLRPTFFGCDPAQNPPEWPLVLYLPNAPPFNGSRPVTNSGTFQLQYSLEHTQAFLDQTHNNTISGFVPNSNSADPNWGKCLQCGAIDRARYKSNPVVPRSDFCTTCFQQYCYNSSSPPSASQLPNRNLEFLNLSADAGIRSIGVHLGVVVGVAVGLVSFIL
ncbi:phospholipase B [Amylostereum chailletii]|nr:phospholipase B [Amylostereum chailletii]